MTDPYAIGEGAQRIFRSVRDERDQLRAQVAELEEQLRELRVYADHADWCEREVLELLDVTEDREMPGECRVIAKEIRAVYARRGGGDAGYAREGVSAPRRRDSGARATESTPETAQAISEPAATIRLPDGNTWPATEFSITPPVPMQTRNGWVIQEPRLGGWHAVIQGRGTLGIMARAIDVDIHHQGQHHRGRAHIVEGRETGPDTWEIRLHGGELFRVDEPPQIEVNVFHAWQPITLEDIGDYMPQITQLIPAAHHGRGHRIAIRMPLWDRWHCSTCDTGGDLRQSEETNR